MSSPALSAHPVRSVVKRMPMYATFKQLGHYPDFWWWKLRGEPQRIPHIVKQRAVLEYAQAFGLRTLVETGTYYGEMIAAVRHRFRRVYSIELDPGLAMLASERFCRHRRVTILQGDSHVIVPQLAKERHEACLWWLDAGYCGWVGEMGNPDRLATEFSAILGAGKDHVILMDDADGVVGLGELIASVRSRYPGHEVEVARNIIRVTPHKQKI